MLANRLYLDNAATSFPKPPRVIEAMTDYAARLGASAGRGAYREATETGAILLECRRRLCRLFNGQSAEQVVFTLNCSDALNIAIKGLLDPKRSNHAICTHTDHNSILRPLRAMQEQGITEVTRVPVDPSNGRVDPDDVRRAIRPNTRLIAITHVSNVTGAVQPIGEFGAIADQHGIPLVVDAAQSAGHVPIDVQAENIALLAAPGHKGLLGPLGTGFLYVRSGLEKSMHTIREGGTGSQSDLDRHPESMPDKFEPGSHNAIGLAGLSAAAGWITERTVASLQAHDLDLCRTFLEAIADIEGLTLHGPNNVRNRVGVFSVTLAGYDPHELSAILESEFGILTRSGIHCAPLIHETLGTTAGGGTTRFSFGPFVSQQDVSYAADALAHIASEAAAVTR